jgi:hypothetical protein
MASIVILLMASAANIAAHHGVAAYDMSKTVNVRGVIEKVVYENPHGYLWLRVDDKVYYIELAALERMQNAGLAKDMLAPGTTVTVIGAPHRTDPLQMKTRRLILTGETIQLGPGVPATLAQQKPAAISDLPSSTVEQMPIQARHEWLLWLEGTPVAEAMRERRLLYPTVEIIHILGIVVMVGAAFFFDLRLLGLSRQLSVAQVSRYVLPWARLSVLAVIPAGILMFMANATALAGNPVFRLKLTLIAMAALNALLFHTAIGRSLKSWDTAIPAAAKVSAVVSLVVWISVISCGRLLAFF